MNKNITFDKLVAELGEVKKWLEQLGVKNLDKSRLSSIIEYSAQLNDEHSKYSKGQSNNLSNLNRNVETAVYEALALISIYHGFSRMDQSHLPKRKIEKCLLGSYSSLEENQNDNSNQARNTLFELETNAYIKLCDLNLTNEFEDANIDFGEFKVSIQCKRPLSEKNLISNVKNAYDQLVINNKIKTDIKSYGLIAISLEKLYELDKIRFVQNREDLDRLILGISKDCLSKIKDYWIKIKNTKLLGFMLYFKSTIVFKDSGGMQGVNFFIIDLPRPNKLSSPRWKIISSLQKLTKIRVGEQNFM